MEDCICAQRVRLTSSKLFILCNQQKNVQRFFDRNSPSTNSTLIILDLLFYNMMQTLLAGQQTEDRNLSPFRDATIFHPKQPNTSHSPKKIRTSKKFFYSVRNKSIKQIDPRISAQKQLESLLRKQKVMLISHQGSINDLLLPVLNVPIRDSDMLAFPSIDIKKIIQTDSQANYIRKKIEKKGLVDLIDLKKNYQSNILREKPSQFDTLPHSKHPNWSKSSQNPQISKERTFIAPKIQPKKAYSDFINNTDSPNVRQSEPLPPNISQARSMSKLQEISNDQKKFKKGFLPYQNKGQQLWLNIKQGIIKDPLVKIDNHYKILTAKIFYVYDLQNNQPIVCHKQQEQIQIASLSKIMTCYLSILICKKYEIDIKSCIYRVPDKIQGTPGTSAQLQAGDLLTVEDLLYALMLPSGNDASICLGEAMGKVIQRYKKKQQKKSYIETFINHMNGFSKELGLNQKWNNTSGLPHNPNFSSAQAIMALASLAIKNNLFRKIVTTREIQVEIKNDRYGLKKKYIWRNTNKLLQKGWEGVKTGTTQTAGHCLISRKESLLLGLFDCQTMAKRFTQSLRLHDHLIKMISKS